MTVLSRVVLALWVGTGACVQAHGEDLVVLLTPHSVPFSYADEQGRLTGFNVDVANAVCRELGRGCRLEVRPFPDILPAVAAGRADLGIANFLRTPERDALVRFSIPYWRSTSVFIGRADRALAGSSSFLEQGQVCVVEGSMQARYLGAHAGEHAANLRALPSNQGVLDHLHNGLCQVALLPTMQAFSFLKSSQGQGFAFVAAPISEAGLGGTVHMIVRPDDPDLQDEVDRAIASLIRSGEHERTARRYFPFNIF